MLLLVPVTAQPPLLGPVPTTCCPSCAWRLLDGSGTWWRKRCDLGGRRGQELASAWERPPCGLPHGRDTRGGIRWQPGTLCLPPAAPWVPCQSRSGETRSRVISAALQAEPLQEFVTCPGLAPAQNHFPLLREGRLKGGTAEGRCSQPCSGSHPFFQRCAGEGKEQQCFPAQTGHQSS